MRGGKEERGRVREKKGKKKKRRRREEMERERKREGWREAKRKDEVSIVMLMATNNRMEEGR